MTDNQTPEAPAPEQQPMCDIAYCTRTATVRVHLEWDLLGSPDERRVEERNYCDQDDESQRADFTRPTDVYRLLHVYQLPTA